MGSDKIISKASSDKTLCYTEIASAINFFENKYPVNSWVHNNLHVWPLIRLHLGMKLYKLAETPVKKTQSNQASDNSWLKNKFIALKNRINLFITDQKLSGPSDILFLSFPASRIKIGKYWINKLIDPMVSHLKDKGKILFIELKGPAEYKTPRFNDGLCVPIEMHKDKYLWGGNHQNKYSYELESYDEFYLELKQKFPWLKVTDLEKEQLLLRLHRFNVLVNYFKSILLKSKVRFCFTTCYYDFNAFALSTACKLNNIPFVDVQHGIQNKYHVGYGSWDKIPEQGYEMLPSYFWCWNKEDADMINKWALKTKAHQAIHGGNPSIEMWKENEFSQLTLDYENAIRQKNKDIKDPVNILFSTQPVNNAIPELLIEVVKRSPSNWRWWIRLHPRQQETSKEIFNSLENKESVNLKEASSFPLPVLLKNMDVHITQWSSVVLEASAMGIPSIVIHENGNTIFKDQIENGEVSYASDSESLINLINRFKKKEHNIKKEFDFKNRLDKLIDSTIGK